MQLTRGSVGLCRVPSSVRGFPRPGVCALSPDHCFLRAPTCDSEGPCRSPSHPNTAEPQAVISIATSIPRTQLVAANPNNVHLALLWEHASCSVKLSLSSLSIVDPDKLQSAMSCLSSHFNHLISSMKHLSSPAVPRSPPQPPAKGGKAVFLPMSLEHSRQVAIDVAYI